MFPIVDSKAKRSVRTILIKSLGEISQLELQEEKGTNFVFRNPIVNMKILIVEDEPKVAAFLQQGLEEHGYETDVVYDGQMGKNFASKNNYQVILLDVIIPYINGIELCKTNRLAMGFDVPANKVEKVHFKITAPDGRIISNEQAGLTYRVIENNSNLLASLSPQSGEIEVTKRIEMTYKPIGKLSAGVYKIDIFDNDIYMSTCQVMLR